MPYEAFHHTLYPIPLLLLCLCSPNVTAEVITGTCGANGDNLTWSLDTEDSTLTISGNGAMADYEDIDHAPWYYNRSQIKTVVIEKGVTSIGEYAFYGCSSLTEFTVSEGNAGYSAIDGVLFNKEKNTLVLYPNAKAAVYVIPDGVTSIGGYAFQYCSGLTSVTIPNSVTNIEEAAFEWCTGLTGITIPNSVTVIGEEAFESCTGLTSVIIGNSVTNIGEEAFHHCEGLANVIIGSSVTNIEFMAFADCVGLTEIHSKNPTPPSTGEDVFGGEYEVDKTTCKLYVPVGAKAAYAAAGEWKDFKNIIEEETGVSPVAASSVRAYASGGGITIETGRPVKVSVYTVSGQKVYQSLLVGTAEIRLNSGVYIVKADNVSQKVVVE